MTTGFVDIHCHLIPGIDDGPQTMEESLKMCNMAYENGSRTIVATPHVNPGVHNNSWEDIQAGFKHLQDAVTSAEIPLDLRVGADVRVNEMLMQIKDPKNYFTINNNNKYMLLEFPETLIPPNTDRFLFELKLKGITPIITHPERNYEIQRNPNLLYHFVNMGMLVQLTAMSITGEFGDNLDELSELLLMHNLVHVVASDAHSAVHRPPLLSEAFKAVAALAGEDKALELFVRFPGAIVDGIEVTPEEPYEISYSPGSMMTRGIKRIKRFFNNLFEEKGG